MKFAHSVNFRLILNKEAFNDDKLKLLLSPILPDEVLFIFEENVEKDLLKKEKIEFSIEDIALKDALKVRGELSKIVDGCDLIKVELSLSKEKHINLFLDKLKNELGTDVCSLIAEQENRVDENCNLFIRLDLDELQKGNFVLTDSGNCVHIKIKLATYPNKKEIALKVVKEIFKN